MQVTVDLADLAPLVEEAVARALEGRQEGPAGFVDAAGAAEHLAMSEAAVRSLVQRREIPFVRTPNGRIRFERSRLDEWARSASCTS